MNEQFIHYIGVGMSHEHTNFPDFQSLRRRIILSLGINALLPLLLYALSRPLLASDAVALAIAAAIPALRTLILWIWRWRVDWIGAPAVLGFGLALALTTPTATYLALSYLVTIAILGGGAGLLAWMRRHNNSLAGS
jgi:hypothetical protein